MNTYVFSDPHFDSVHIIQNAKRPFKNTQEMNSTIIKLYNATISKKDICYWLGDIMYDATKEKVRKIIFQMKGRKYLIMGNHDRSHSENWWLDCGFDKVFRHPVYIEKKHLILSHEPLPEFGNLPTVANYHGHIHINDYDFPVHEHCINVCVEKTNYRPVLLVNPFFKQSFER